MDMLSSDKQTNKKSIKQTHIQSQVFLKFSRNKKVGLVRDTPKHENNMPTITSSWVVDNPARNMSYIPPRSYE